MVFPYLFSEGAVCLEKTRDTRIPTFRVLVFPAKGKEHPVNPLTHMYHVLNAHDE